MVNKSEDDISEIHSFLFRKKLGLAADAERIHSTNNFD